MTYLRCSSFHFYACNCLPSKVSHLCIVLVCSLQEALLSLVYVQRPYWKCFQYQGSFSPEEVRGDSDPQIFTPTLSFMGLTSCRPLRFPTRDNNEPQTPETLQRIVEKFHCLQQRGMFILAYYIYLAGF